MSTELLAELETVDYELLNKCLRKIENSELCRKMLRYFEETFKFADVLLKYKVFSFDKNIIYSTHVSPQEAVDLSYDFFQSISKDFASRFLNIINYGSVKFAYRKNEENTYNHVDQYGNVCISLEGTVKDIYIIVHELIHKLGNPYNQTSLIRLFLTESPSITGEFLVYDFLQRKGIFYERELMINILNDFSLYRKYAITIREEYNLYKLFLEKKSLDFKNLLNYIVENDMQESRLKILLVSIRRIECWKGLSFLFGIRYIIELLFACNFYLKTVEGQMINSDFEWLVHILGDPDWKDKENMDILRGLDIPILKENVDLSNVTDDYHKVLSLLKNDWLKR